MVASRVGPLFCFAAVIAGLSLIARLSSEGGNAITDDSSALSAPQRPSSVVNSAFPDLMPKAFLDVVKGEKTAAPAVPAAVTRRQNKIVEYDLTVRETAARITPTLTYASLWAFDGIVPGPVMRVKVGDVVRFTL